MVPIYALYWSVVKYLSIKPLFVGHKVATFQISFKEPKVHGPAVTGYLVVIVCLRPTGMMKSEVSHAVLFFQHEADAGSLPIFMRFGKLQLEFSRQKAARNLCLPIVIGTEV